MAQYEGNQGSTLTVRDLIRVPHKDGGLFVSYPAFGPDKYLNNLIELQNPHFHPKTGERIYLRKPTISESISIAAHLPETKSEILDESRLQLGLIVMKPSGVFTNPPDDEQGNPIIDGPIADGRTLRSFLKKAKETRGIYICENGLGFAPWESLRRKGLTHDHPLLDVAGGQDSDAFSKSGLARLLEHTESEVALNLKKISAPENYRRGGFYEDFNPHDWKGDSDANLRVACLCSGVFLADGRLIFDTYHLEDTSGFTFGVLDERSKK